MKRYLTALEIKQLKSELMSGKSISTIKTKKSLDKNKTDSGENPKTPSSFSQKEFAEKYFELKNKEIGLDFEDNIRNILNHYYKWNDGLYDRHFFYREIIYKESTKIVITGKKIQFEVNKNEIIIFQLNKDNTLDAIINGEKTPIKDQESTTFKKNDIEFKIGKLNEVEMDGVFNIRNFSCSIFNKEEISVIYQNVDDKEMQKYENAIVEIKLNKNKFEDLINQLYNDKKLMDKMTKKNILYIGFINSKKIENISNKISKKCEKMNCVIFGIKNSIFSNKKITKAYDWTKIIEDDKKFNLIEQKLNQLDNKIDNKISQLENKISQLDNKISLLDNKINVLISISLDKNKDTNIDNNDNDDDGKDDDKSIQFLKKKRNDTK